MSWGETSHAEYACKYHLIWYAKRQHRRGDAELQAWGAKAFRAITEELDSRIKELAIGSDHVHPFVGFPPRCSVVRGRNSQGHLREPSFPPLPVAAGAILVGRTLRGRL
jgi:REP element-mobilizing transposase RayT